jgi:alanine dehydrogenase
MQGAGSGPKPVVLTRSELESLLTFDNVLPGVRDGFVAVSDGTAQLFPLIRQSLADDVMFGLRSAYWEQRRLLGLKASGYYPANRAAGLDSHQATVLLLDPATGQLIAVVDGNHITWIRTAVAGALGSSTLARADARRVLLVGNGLQAEAQALSHHWLLRDRQPLFKVHAPRDDSARGKARTLVERLAAHGLRAESAPDLRAALDETDIVVTATPSRSPVIPAGAVRPGTHVTAIGADAPGKIELEPALVRCARVIADDPDQAARVGECQSFEGRAPALGDVLTGRAPGRSGEEEITVFDSTGLAIHDLVTAATAMAMTQGNEDTLRSGLR